MKKKKNFLIWQHQQEEYQVDMYIIALHNCIALPSPPEKETFQVFSKELLYFPTTNIWVSEQILENWEAKTLPNSPVTPLLAIEGAWAWSAFRRVPFLPFSTYLSLIASAHALNWKEKQKG